MQKWIACSLLLLCSAVPAAAQAVSASSQETSRIELSVGYTLVHSNAPPANCGCFSMNGGTGAVAFHLAKGLSAVADFTAAYNGNVDSSGQSLLLASYLFGPRYSLRNWSRFTPFGEAFAGEAHGSGLGYSGTTGPATAFATAVGGGLDFRANRHVAVRLLEADYYFTHFQNAVNSRQNNLRLTFGVVFGFGRR